MILTGDDGICRIWTPSKSTGGWNVRASFIIVMIKANNTSCPEMTGCVERRAERPPRSDHLCARKSSGQLAADLLTGWLYVDVG